MSAALKLSTEKVWQTRLLEHSQTESYKEVTVIRKTQLHGTIKLFTSVIVAISKYARVFDTSILFHPSLIFTGKAEAYQSEAPYGTPP